MTYDAQIEAKLDVLTQRWQGRSQKKMFGGIGYMVHGNVCVGAWKDMVILRIGRAQRELIASEEWYRPFDITGKVMQDWAMMTAVGWRDDGILREMVAMAKTYVGGLPRKG